MSHTKWMPDEVLQRKTKYGMVDYIQGYICALRDVIDDHHRMENDDKMSDAMWELIIQSMESAEKTLKVLTEETEDDL